MSRDIANEIVRALTQALSRALEAGSGERSGPVARDVAQVLGLDGLDQALRVIRSGRTDVAPLRDTLRALTDRCAAEGSLAVFIEVDKELERLAERYGAPALVRGAPTSPEGTLGAAEALDELPLADDISRAVAERARLTAQVTAALRAALDWLTAGEVRPLRLRAEDSALDVVLTRVHRSGLTPASVVLAAVGGNIGPALATSGHLPGSWLVRVPLASARETYLMVTQGDLDLALPWHAVLRLCMTPSKEFEANLRTLGLPVLSPLVPLSSVAREFPVVLVAHGMKRGYLAADRLIWRLPATPFDAPPDPRLPGYAACVRTEDGRVFRVADPVLLLEAVEVPEIPEITEALEIDTPEAAALSSAPQAPLEPHTPEAPIVAPYASAAAPVPAMAEDAGPESALQVLEPARVTALPLRALVADDSIGTRVSLAHALEREGFEVREVATAAELREALDAEAWALVCVDVELPDASGYKLLRDAIARAQGAPVAALVRDQDDRKHTKKAGLSHVLDKPVGNADLLALLAKLGLAGASRS